MYETVSWKLYTYLYNQIVIITFSHMPLHYHLKQTKPKIFFENFCDGAVTKNLRKRFCIQSRFIAFVYNYIFPKSFS